MANARKGKNQKSNYLTRRQRKTFKRLQVLIKHKIQLPKPPSFRREVFFLTLKTMATYLTQEGFDKKMAELAALEAQRPQIKNAIAEARDKGDLSENAEYDAAKEAQGMLEMKIAKIKELISNARIIDESKISTDEVQLLTKVTIKNLKTGLEMAYTIVTENEANLRERKISSSTPIAQGLLGHKVGDIVKVQAPAGVIDFEIIKIEL